MGDVPPFYSKPGLHTEIYDVFAAAQAADDLPFWVAMATELGGPVLEAACGTGRVSWAVADAGFEVVGFDNSPAMLSRAEAKRGDHPDARATFHLAGFLDVDLGRAFPLVIVPFRAFQILTTVEEQLLALERLRRHLVPGGHLVIDLFDPRLEYLVPHGRPHTAMTFDHPERPTRVRIDTTDRVIDPVAQTFTETWRFTELGHDDVLRSETEQLTLRWIYRYEAMHLLRLAGYEIVAEWSDFDRSPPAYGKEQIWVTRRR